MAQTATLNAGDTAKLMENLKIDESVLKSLAAVVKKENSPSTISKTIVKTPMAPKKTSIVRKTKLPRLSRRFLETSTPIPKMASFDDSDDEMK